MSPFSPEPPDTTSKAGARQENHERDMREILTQASPSGRFSVRLLDNILRIWRLPA
jgi:hypothetical protein